MPFAADPGFVERAARYSAFGAGPRSYNNPQLGPGGVAEPGKLSRVSSSQSLKAAAASMPPSQMQMDGTGQLENDAMMRTMMMTMMRSGASPGGGVPEESSASDRMVASGSEGNVRKRKAKAKDAPPPPPPHKVSFACFDENWCYLCIELS